MFKIVGNQSASITSEELTKRYFDLGQLCHPEVCKCPHSLLAFSKLERYYAELELMIETRTKDGEEKTNNSTSGGDIRQKQLVQEYLKVNSAKVTLFMVGMFKNYQGEL